eukprot:TRINITY_DN7539_c0_g1_i1.p2 TRINITY_DN7539_c0_g1~~TRINITY_DN7539_c0_g1_i1.p2  ORF type:complete len:267 (+),score=50.11 TRINITY_DN7539_c0_g1_i1:131-931(+)
MFVFFFQAEDGIRDAQESRGLGDVYKRQVEGAQFFIPVGGDSRLRPAILSSSPRCTASPTVTAQPEMNPHTSISNSLMDTVHGNSFDTPSPSDASASMLRKLCCPRRMQLARKLSSPPEPSHRSVGVRREQTSLWLASDRSPNRSQVRRAASHSFAGRFIMSSANGGTGILSFCIRVTGPDTFCPAVVSPSISVRVRVANSFWMLLVRRSSAGVAAERKWRSPEPTTGGTEGSPGMARSCLLYTSDAADEEDSVDLGGGRNIKKKK